MLARDAGTPSDLFLRQRGLFAQTDEPLPEAPLQGVEGHEMQGFYHGPARPCNFEIARRADARVILLEVAAKAVGARVTIGFPRADSS